jgi:hypothetical protein
MDYVSIYIFISYLCTITTDYIFISYLRTITTDSLLEEK